MSARGRWVRWKAVVPLTVFLGLVAGVWWLLLDRAVERAVEDVGAVVVGARVDLASADVRVTDGAVTFRGLAVTNPDAPMTNLFEAEEIVADVAVRPLLMQRVVVESLAVRGVRFGTARETSGALDHPSAASRAVRSEVDAWANSVRIPALSLSGLRQGVDLSRLTPDSLHTFRVARDLTSDAATVEQTFRRQIAGLDPSPRIDSARALARELSGANILSLGVGGVTRLVGRTRATLDVLGGLERSLAQVDSSARGQMADLNRGLAALEDAHAADVRWAMGRLQLPTLDAPTVSTAIFGRLAVEWVRPVLYWLNVADRFVPPGLDPRRMAGSKRARRAGTTVHYPGGTEYPRFLLEHADVDMVLGGAGVAAGAYGARLTGLTTDPAIYGRPLEVTAGRTGATAGPRDLALAAVIDRAGAAARDSVDARAAGLTLPTLTLEELGAALALGQGTTELHLVREAGSLRARWHIEAPAVRWTRLAAAPASPPARGSQAWLADLLWRSVAGVRNVELDMEVVGDPARPSLAVRSNVGRAVVQSVRAELGRELERAQADVRAEVQRLVGDEVAAAEARVAALRDTIAERVGVPREQLAAVQAELRAQLQRLGR